MMEYTEEEIMYQKLANDISVWLTTYLQESSLKCFVVGVSGGIDSAVTSSLCASTGIQTYVVNLPIHSLQKLSSLADLHCNDLQKKYPNITYLTIDGTKVYDALIEAVAPNGAIDLLAGANSKSRIRMMLLYYIAGKHQGIVVGTGNKVEDFGVGFYTKYGDGGVDISPIANLSKTQVRNLGEILGIDTQIIQAPPTDGLWEDERTDEEQIGASYEELEWAMDNINENHNAFSNREKEVMDIYLHFHKKNQHKMQAIPVFIPPNSIY